MQLAQSAAPGLLLHDTDIKYLLYADHLVLLSPTEKGLQQNLALVEDWMEDWWVIIPVLCIRFGNKNSIYVFHGNKAF